MDESAASLKLKQFRLICLYLSKPQQVFKAKYEGLRLYMYIYAIVYKILFCKQVVQLYYIA